MRTARELRGLAQYASIAIPALRTELSVLDVMLSANKADGGFIRPNVEGRAAEEAAWQACACYPRARRAVAMGWR